MNNVKEENVIPAQLLAEAGTRDPMELTKLGVVAAREERWKAALVLLAEAYNVFNADPILKDEVLRIERDAEEPIARKQARGWMFSYYGLALAMSSHSRAAEGARFCELAIRAEPYQAEHYVNLARIWQAGRNRQKTVEAVDRGLKELPKSQILLELRGEIGWRAQNAIAFLPREHPLNVALGRMLRKKRPRSGVRPRPKAGVTAAPKAPKPKA